MCLIEECYLQYQMICVGEALVVLNEEVIVVVVGGEYYLILKLFLIVLECRK